MSSPNSVPFDEQDMELPEPEQEEEIPAEMEDALDIEPEPTPESRLNQIVHESLYTAVF